MMGIRKEVIRECFGPKGISGIFSDSMLTGFELDSWELDEESGRHTQR